MSLGGAFSIIGVGPQGVYKAKAGGGAPAITARTQAFLTASGITDPQISNALNTMDLSLISAGLLPAGTGAGKIKVLYPFVGGTAATHKFNFVNPLDTDAANRLNFLGGWTHSANGALASSVNGYADTFFVPNGSNITNSSSHLSNYVRNNLSIGVQMGSQDVSNNADFYLYNRFSGNSGTRLGNSTQGTAELLISQADGSGMFVSSRNGTTTLNIYKNGISIGSGTRTIAASYSTRKIFLGAYNFQGNPGLYSGSEFVYGSIGEGLNATEVSNYYNLVQTFQTTLGRNV
jgi:hypothetical protein